MTFSLNEVAALAKKAARGAGFPWGMADEAAYATRWVCARGIDGCAALAACLEAVNASEVSFAPNLLDAEWRAADSRPLCPVHTGAALSDRAADQIRPGDTLTLGPVLAPVLMLPFVAQAARRAGAVIRVEVGHTPYLVDVDTLDPSHALPIAPQLLVLSRTTNAPKPRDPVWRAMPDAATWERLTQLAHRTYAPATAASRAKGAGGDLPDTD